MITCILNAHFVAASLPGGEPWPSRADAALSRRSFFMRLTGFTDYALRVLMYVGAKGESLSTVEEIADAYGVSRHHLTKVVHRLGQLGYLETLRGKHGGIRLARDPSEINLGTVVRQTEDELALVPCLPGGGPACRLASACVLKGVVGEALSAFLSVFDRHTLADLLGPRRKLVNLLSIAAT
jgi:Rrf2 family nitric oxide-sensitive transcriptional repressor